MSQAITPVVRQNGTARILATVGAGFALALMILLGSTATANAAPTQSTVSTTAAETQRTSTTATETERTAPEIGTNTTATMMAGHSTPTRIDAAKDGFSISGGGISSWLKSNIVPIILVIVGIVIAVAAITKKVRDAMVAALLGVVAIIFLVIAANWEAIGNWASRTFFGGN